MKFWVCLGLALGAAGCSGSSSGSSPGSSSSPSSVPGTVANAVTTGSSSSATTGTSTTSTGSGTTTTTTYPSSASWMTEAQEVAWYNSIGFNTTLAELQASYTSFTPAPISSTTNVEWGTETDDLRNYYRLYKRTGYAGFLQQAQYLHDWMVDTYSVTGSSASIGTEHVYLMGLVDWYVDYQDAPTQAAINRILAYIKANLPTSYYETRVSARMLECLCYFKEKLGWTNVDTEITTLISQIQAAPVYNGFISFPKYYVGMGETADGQPSGTSLDTLFPKNVGFKTSSGTPLIASPTTFNLEGFPGVASFQDMILCHALLLAARVENEPALVQTELDQATAWLQISGYPFWDPTGASTNLIIGYNVVPDAPDLTMFKCYDGDSTPLYCTQYAAYCPNASMMKQLQQQALLRQYSQYDKIQASELGGKPRYWLWQTWEEGYYLTQPITTSSP
jgi:hypothetical protein